MLIPLDKIISNPQQPRRDFDQDELNDLAESIRTHGVILPISVEDAGETYILIDGERRVRAARLAGLTEIEASVRPGLNGSGQAERLILATVANVQRSDLNPLEKALAFQRLMDLGMSQQKVANTVGCHLATIANHMLILRMPEYARELIGEGKLTADPLALRALAELDEPQMRAVIRGAVNSKLSGQQVRTLTRRMAQGKKVGKRKAAKSKDDLSHTWQGRWNMIAQAGNPHICAELAVAAIGICKECPLFEDASPKICRDCPAPQLLKKVAEVHS
jgi:ParB family chromosome partitioning protein